MEISFTVYGTPTPQGSTKAFIPKGWKRAIITSDNKKLKPWRQEVTGAALAALDGTPQPHEGPVEVRCVFYFAKPKSTSKRVKHKITKPDIDKLTRAIYDALTGVLYRDDSQIVNQIQAKRFSDVERAEITVKQLSSEEVVPLPANAVAQMVIALEQIAQ